MLKAWIVLETELSNAFYHFKLKMDNTSLTWYIFVQLVKFFPNPNLLYFFIAAENLCEDKNLG